MVKCVIYINTYIFECSYHCLSGIDLSNKYSTNYFHPAVKTKPGVIRPVLVKGRIAQQKEELYQPNPFKKYLEEISDQDVEQVSNSHSEGLCSLSYFL